MRGTLSCWFFTGRTGRTFLLIGACKNLKVLLLEVQCSTSIKIIIMAYSRVVVHAYCYVVDTRLYLFCYAMHLILVEYIVERHYGGWLWTNREYVMLVHCISNVKVK